MVSTLKLKRTLSGDDYLFTQMYVGCYTDKNVHDYTHRSFQVQMGISWYGMTLWQCMSSCLEDGFRYVALEVSPWQYFILDGTLLTFTISCILEQRVLFCQNSMWTYILSMCPCLLSKEWLRKKNTLENTPDQTCSVEDHSLMDFEILQFNMLCWGQNGYFRKILTNSKRSQCP